MADPERTTIDPGSEGVTPGIGQQLTYPIDNTSKRILERTILEFLPSDITDILWNNLFYYSSFFESLDRYTLNVFGGSVVIGVDGMVITTAATTNDTEGASLDVSATGAILREDRRSRFRTVVKLDNVAKTLLSILSNDSDQTPGGYIEFIIDKAIIKGRTSDGTSTNTVILGTAIINKDIVLEYQYLPGKQVVFLVNGIQAGVSSKNLPIEPTSDAGTISIFSATLLTYENSAHGVTIKYFEYIQDR